MSVPRKVSKESHVFLNFHFSFEIRPFILKLSNDRKSSNSNNYFVFEEKISIIVFIKTL